MLRLFDLLGYSVTLFAFIIGYRILDKQMSTYYCTKLKADILLGLQSSNRKPSNTNGKYVIPNNQNKPMVIVFIDI